MAQKAKSNIMWGSRFSTAPEHVLQSINVSIDLINNCIRCNHDVSIFKKKYLYRCVNIAKKMKLFKPNKFNLFETK